MAVLLRCCCLLLPLLGACAVAPSRPARSTLGCAQTVVAGMPEVAAEHRHCVAAGFIARHCSRTEAYLAAAGKELADLFGPGDADWEDWQADRAGIRCAAAAASDENLAACCALPEETDGLRN